MSIRVSARSSTLSQLTFVSEAWDCSESIVMSVMASNLSFFLERHDQNASTLLFRTLPTLQYSISLPIVWKRSDGIFIFRKK